jgi:hypothetical protein
VCLQLRLEVAGLDAAPVGRAAGCDALHERAVVDRQVERVERPSTVSDWTPR